MNMLHGVLTAVHHTITRIRSRWLMSRRKANPVMYPRPKGRDPGEDGPEGRAAQGQGPNSNRPVSLGTLLTFAEGCINDEADRRPGRRATVHGSREVWHVSSKTLQKAKTALYKVARSLDVNAGSSPDRLREVLDQQSDRSLFLWDPNGGVGQAGDWCRILETVSLATGGSPESISAVRTLMDLAATHCVIPRSVRHDQDPPLDSKEWRQLRTEWTDLVRGRTSRISEGVGGLIGGCHRLGIDPTRTVTSDDWVRVAEHLEEHFRIEGTDPAVRTAIRTTYRTLAEHGVINGPEWTGLTRKGGTGLCLVQGRYIRHIAQCYGREGKQPGVHKAAEARAQGRDIATEFPWPGFEDLPGLVEGPFGLRAALTCFTAPDDILQELGIPSKRSFPRQRIRGTSRKSKLRWRVKTCEGNLRIILTYSGWLERYRGVDFSQEGSDLRVILGEDHVRAYVRAVRAGMVSSLGQLRRVLVVLARLGSPFAEAVALTHNAPVLADRFHRVSRLLNSPGTVDGYSSLNTAISERLKGTYARTKQITRKVEDAWTRSNQLAKHAHDQMCRVRDTLILCIEDEGGGSLKELADRLDAGDFTIDRELALLIRSAIVWADQLQIPLRPETMSRLSTSERLHDPQYERLRAIIPGSKLKTGGAEDFRPNYRTGSQSTYPRHLYRLYIAPRGAREVLRTDGSGRVHPTDAFYVPVVAPGASDRLNGSSFNAIVRSGLRTALRYASNCLKGLTYGEIAPLTTAHRFRHAFATKMDALGLRVHAARCLHHASTDMLDQVYSARSEEDCDPGAMMADREEKDEPEGQG